MTLWLSGMEITADRLNFGIAEIITKNSTESVTSSTVLQDDDELFTSLAADAKYLVECWVMHNSATAGDITLGWTVPTGATFNWGVIGAELSTTSSSAVTEVVMTSRTTTQQANLGGGASTGTIAVLNGIITTTDAGTLTLQWAQRVSSGTATQVQVGSYLKTTRIS